MALRKFLILRRPPTGPRCARPEDRLRGRLEGRTILIQAILDFLTAPQAGAHSSTSRAPEQWVPAGTCAQAALRATGMTVVDMTMIPRTSRSGQ